MPKINISNLSNEKQRTCNKAWTTSRGNIKNTKLPFRDDSSNDFKLIILETDQRNISPFMRLFCEEQQKYIQSSQNNATYHPMNPVTYQAVNLFSSDRCFIYFTTFDEISATLSIQFW